MSVELIRVPRESPKYPVHREKKNRHTLVDQSSSAFATMKKSQKFIHIFLKFSPVKRNKEKAGVPKTAQLGKNKNHGFFCKYTARNPLFCTTVRTIQFEIKKSQKFILTLFSLSMDFTFVTVNVSNPPFQKSILL